MTRRTVAIVPLRAPGAGKTRLATVLDPAQRARLATAMLADVAAALTEAGIDELVVAADGEGAASAALALDLRVVLDAPGVPDLNRILTDATRAVGAGSDVLVVAADLPCLCRRDIEELLAVDAAVVVAPTNGGGTGGLLRRPGDRIAPSYGPASARRHVQLAETVGASVHVQQSAGFRHDVDTWADLAALRRREVGASTAEALPELLTGRARAG